MKKNIWIINDYAGSPYHGEEMRHYFLSKELVELKYDVTIISGSYSHLLKNKPKLNGSYTIERIDNINYVWVKVPEYKSSESKMRVIKWFIYALKIFLLPFRKISIPDVIIASPTAPFSVIPAYFISRKKKAKLIYEVKDVWPKSLIELGSISTKHPLIKMMSFCEKFALKRADKIVSNLSSYENHIKELNINKSSEWISNGINVIDYNKDIYVEPDIEKLIPSDKFLVGYVGSFGVSNALEYLVDAIKKINDTDLRNKFGFVFVGDGQLKKWMKKELCEYNNVVFIDRVDKKIAFNFMSRMDLLFKGNLKKEIYKFGISPIKIYEYMYSEVPIIHSTNVKDDIVKKANCGVSVMAEDTNVIVEGILEMFNMDKKYRRILGKNGKKFVLEHFTYNKLAGKYDQLINDFK